MWIDPNGWEGRNGFLALRQYGTGVAVGSGETISTSFVQGPVPSRPPITIITFPKSKRFSWKKDNFSAYPCPSYFYLSMCMARRCSFALSRLNQHKGSRRFPLVGLWPCWKYAPPNHTSCCRTPMVPNFPKCSPLREKSKLTILLHYRKPYQCNALAWHQTYLKVATPFPPRFSHTGATTILLWSVDEPHWCLGAWSACFTAGSPCTPICPSAVNCKNNLDFPGIIYMRRRQTWSWREVEAQIKFCIIITSEHWGGGNKDIIAHIPNLCVVTDNVTKVSGLKVQLNAINEQFRNTTMNWEQETFVSLRHNDESPLGWSIGRV